MDFGSYKLIDCSHEYLKELHIFLDQGYKSIGYTGLELDTLDNDLCNIEKVYANPSCFKLLIDADGKIIGSVAVKIKDKEAELKRVFVDPACRGQGLGKKLSQWGFVYARERGASFMHIWSGTLCKTAHILYEKLGANKTGEKRCIGGQDDCYEYYFLKELE
jgi:GNAT superfamily N-acetyltransferase